MRTWTRGATVIVMAALSMGADWLHFRGTDTNGATDGDNFPAEWDVAAGTNVAWQADLVGRGVSSPIVVGGRVVLTASSGAREERLHVLCFDAATGKQAWHRQFWATGRTFCHPTSSVAAPTPASDGERIFAFYSSNDLACLDLEGNLLWFRGLTHDYPNAANDVGMAASPVVVNGAVIVQVENEADSFAAGLDARTGENLWRLDRDQRMNWTSPAVFRKGGEGDLVLLQSPTRITAHEPRTGNVAWTYEAECHPISSPVVVGDTVYVPSGGLLALKCPDPSAAPAFVWQQNKLPAGSASPVIHDGNVYVVSSAGVLSCGSAGTGNPLWQLRLEGQFWATPIVSGNRLVAVSQDGLAQVVDLSGKQGKVVGKHPFAEPVLATPAAADGALYFRSDGHLWKIGKS